MLSTLGFFGLLLTGNVIGQPIGRGGFFGVQPAPASGGGGASFTFTAGGPDSTGFWPNPGPFSTFGKVNDMGAFAEGNPSPSYGAITPDPSSIGGKVVTGLGFTDSSPFTAASIAFGIVLRTNATVPQTFFNTLLIGAPLNYTLHTASADYFSSNDPVNGFANYTAWFWAQPGAVGTFIIGQTLTVAAS